MKGLLHTILIMVCLNSISYAQYYDSSVEKKVSGSSFGLKGGLNIATIGGDATGVSSRAAYHFGLFFDIATSESVHFQPELIYSSQGAQSYSGVNANVKYDYINVPLMVKVYAIEGLHFDFGPQIGFVASAKIESKSQTTSVSANVRDELNAFDLALGLGTGYQLNDLRFGFRYNLGLSDTAANSGSDRFPNQVLQFSVGFVLNKF